MDLLCRSRWPYSVNNPNVVLDGLADHSWRTSPALLTSVHPGEMMLTQHAIFGQATSDVNPTGDFWHETSRCTSRQFLSRPPSLWPRAGAETFLKWLWMGLLWMPWSWIPLLICGFRSTFRVVVDEFPLLLEIVTLTSMNFQFAKMVVALTTSSKQLRTSVGSKPYHWQQLWLLVRARSNEEVSPIRDGAPRWWRKTLEHWGQIS